MVALLLDLDGVLRIWDPEIIHRAERRAGLPQGVLGPAAFGDTELLHRAVTGEIDDTMWRATIARGLVERFGERGLIAVREWSEPAGSVNHDVLAIVRRERAVRQIGLLTNATSRLPMDLARLGLDSEVDVVINTSDYGVAKPDPRIFLLASARLGCHISDIAFVDDTAANVSAAAALGMNAHLFTNAKNLQAWLQGIS